MAFAIINRCARANSAPPAVFPQSKKKHSFSTETFGDVPSPASTSPMTDVISKMSKARIVIGHRLREDTFSEVAISISAIHWQNDGNLTDGNSWDCMAWPTPRVGLTGLPVKTLNVCSAWMSKFMCYTVHSTICIWLILLSEGTVHIFCVFGAGIEV